MKKLVSIAALAMAAGGSPAAKLCEIVPIITTRTATPTTWSVANSAGVTISGQSACSQTFPVNSGSARFDPTDGTGGICFCKMTSPKTGVWVLLWNFGTYNYCKNADGDSNTICSSECGRYMSELPGFRKLMLAS